MYFTTRACILLGNKIYDKCEVSFFFFNAKAKSFQSVVFTDFDEFRNRDSWDTFYGVGNY